MRNLRKKYIYLPVLFGVLTPSLVIFILEVCVGHVSPFRSAVGILKRQFAEGENLFLIMAIGFIPFAILIRLTASLSRTIKGKRLDSLFFGGWVGILAAMVLGHVAVWYPPVDGGRVASTSALAFLFIPFFCIAAMALGLLIGWAISRLPFFGAD